MAGAAQRIEPLDITVPVTITVGTHAYTSIRVRATGAGPRVTVKVMNRIEKLHNCRFVFPGAYDPAFSCPTNSEITVIVSEMDGIMAWLGAYLQDLAPEAKFYLV